MYRRIIMWVTACLLGIAAFSLTEKAADAVTIVLDAGHDDTHTGARGNGVLEEMANLQIALSCRNELMKYEGVTVYMIRDSGLCPYGGSSAGSSTACNGKRVDFAASVGANVYISLHNNSSTNTNARGAGVYYPTTNYNYGCGITGQGLAQAIQNQLVAAGLQDRGISVRYSGDNTRYPDGSLADYYGVIRRSKLKGIPAIIVEHAFVSNYSDAVEFLGSYEKMWRLGQLDATAIAGYYGLQKRVELDYSKAALTAEAQNKNTEYVLKTSGVYGAASVQFAVWSENGGQDDLKWYAGYDNGNGCWTATVPVWEHGSEGRYFVHAYANGSVFMRSTEFRVQGPSVSAIDVMNMNEEEGSFEIQLKGVTSGTELAEVTAGIWHQTDQSDLRWVAFGKNADGTYSASVNINQYKYEYGTYQIHVYVRDWNGIKKCVGQKSVDLKPSEARVQYTQENVPWFLKLQTQHVPYGSGVKSLRYTFVTEDGQEVLEAQSVKSAGQWGARVNTAQLGTAGVYMLKTSAELIDGREIPLAESMYLADEFAQEVGPSTGEGVDVWAGETVRVEKKAGGRTDVRLNINPWCDYKWINTKLGTDKRYTEILAYELSWKAETEGIQDAVTQEAADAATGAVVTILVPDSMKGGQVELFHALDVSAEALTPVEYEWSEDGSYITIQEQTEGLFVLAVRENRRQGDADGDGEVTLTDAQHVLRAALHIQEVDAETASACDVDGDGRITLTDAQRILQAALKISSL